MKDSRFDGFGDPTPTHYGEPVPYGDFYAAATGADEELSEAEHRRQERPCLVIEFIDSDRRQQFLDEVIADLRSPAPGRRPLWRLVSAWTTGGALQ